MQSTSLVLATVPKLKYIYESSPRLPPSSDFALLRGIEIFVLTSLQCHLRCALFELAHGKSLSTDFADRSDLIILESTSLVFAAMPL